MVCLSYQRPGALSPAEENLFLGVGTLFHWEYMYLKAKNLLPFSLLVAYPFSGIL